MACKSLGKNEAGPSSCAKCSMGTRENSGMTVQNGVVRQRSIGNLAMSTQPYLSVEEDDRYEREADHVAERVIGNVPFQKQPSTASHNGLQRKAKHKHGLSSRNNVSGVPTYVSSVLDSPGQAIDKHTRHLLEPRFSYDFSQVRIHTNAEAAKSADQLQAQAYTVGSDIVFAAGQYQPHSISGQRLLAHELTHVVQQNAIPPGYASGRIIQRKKRPIPYGGGQIILETVAPVIRVYYLVGKEQHGITEVHARRGAVLDPYLIEVMIAGVDAKGVPIVRITIPKGWKAGINKNVDVKVTEASVDNPHHYNHAKEELEHIRSQYITYMNDVEYHIKTTTTTPIGKAGEELSYEELAALSKNQHFVDWLTYQSRQHYYNKIAAENKALQQYYANPFLSGVEARKKWEEEHGSLVKQTTWEKKNIGKGSSQYKALRNDVTGLVYAYEQTIYLGGHRKLNKKVINVYDRNGKRLSQQHIEDGEVVSTETFERDEHGVQVGGSEPPVEAVYSPIDYALDPLGVQEMMGLAKSDETLEILYDLKTLGIKGLIKQTGRAAKKGLKMARKARLPKGLKTKKPSLIPHSGKVAKSIPDASLAKNLDEVDVVKSSVLSDRKALAKSGRYDGKTLPPALRRAEINIVRKNLDKAVRSNKKGYSIKVDMGNGHSWHRQKGKNKWCRFSARPNFCDTEITPKDAHAGPPSGYKPIDKYKSIDDMPKDGKYFEPLKQGAVYEFEGGHRVWKEADGTVRHESVLGESLGNRKKYEREHYAAKEHGNPSFQGMQRAHSLGQGTGWESPFGLFYAPYEVNQTLQKNGIELFLTQLNKSLPSGAVVKISTNAKPHFGSLKLKEMHYRISYITPSGKTKHLFDYQINVAKSKLPNPAVSDGITAVGDDAFVKSILGGVSGAETFKNKVRPWLSTGPN